MCRRRRVFLERVGESPPRGDYANPRAARSTKLRVGVRVKLFHDVADPALAADAVACGIQRGSESAYAELARRYADQTTTDTTLRRQPCVEQPLAAVVVHARGRHDREQTRHMDWIDHLFLGDGVAAAECQGCAHD